MISSRCSLKYVGLFFLLSITFSISTGSAQTRIYQASALYTPQGTPLTTLPDDGYAIRITMLNSPIDLREEEREHYLDGILMQRVRLIYLLDGRLHRREELDLSSNQLRLERFAYTPDHRLWLVLIDKRSYLFSPSQTRWQEAGRTSSLRFRGDQPLVGGLSSLFRIDASAAYQVEEIWRNGRLQEMRFYRFGELERVRYIQSDTRFDEIIYFKGKEVVRRSLQEGSVVSEEIFGD
jgi:hypothetical protein